AHIGASPYPPDRCSSSAARRPAGDPPDRLRLPIAIPKWGADRVTWGSLGAKPEGTVEADVLAVEVWVASYGLDEKGELLGATHALGKDDRLHQVVFNLLADPQHDRGAHGAGGDGADPHADGRQVAGHGQSHPEDGR